jgi:uncharacterized membrane protein
MNKKIILSLVILLSLFATFAIAADYVTLEPELWKTAGVGSGDGTKISTTSLGDFLSKIFNLGIAIAVALSVVMITFGGVQYMTTDSWNKKEEGKERIRNALYGLGLALISWLILYTINPCLVTFTGTAPDDTKCSNALVTTK